LPSPVHPPAIGVGECNAVVRTHRRDVCISAGLTLQLRNRNATENKIAECLAKHLYNSGMKTQVIEPKKSKKPKKKVKKLDPL
jgi:hypothetical protein